MGPSVRLKALPCPAGDWLPADPVSAKELSRDRSCYNAMYANDTLPGAVQAVLPSGIFDVQPIDTALACGEV
eukprot:13844164-Alexandrium_andersonii.AAC.1